MHTFWLACLTLASETVDVIKVTCKTCKGTGQMALSEVLQNTLEELQATPGRTAPEIINRFPGVGVTALNNRLEDLRALGLVERKRHGKRWRYYPAGTKKEVCGARFEPANGEEVTPCRLAKGHVGRHEGTCLGSVCYWAPEQSKPEACGWDGSRFCSREDCPQIAKGEAATLCPWRKQ